MILDETVRDIDGHLSSKRVAAFAALTCLIVAFVGDTFFGKVPSAPILEALTYITLGGLGMATAERFARKPG